MSTLENEAEDAIAWLTNLLYCGRGAVTFGLTDSGDIGMWYPSESDSPVSFGVEVFEVIEHAMTFIAAQPDAADESKWCSCDGAETMNIKTGLCCRCAMPRR